MLLCVPAPMVCDVCRAESGLQFSRLPSSTSVSVSLIDCAFRGLYAKCFFRLEAT